ncbi:MAG: FecR domain-containing protein [Alphaproteobacteria bacterium]|jgi:transmembrane sensor|nr:FecR domain-containing protein [Alphaproteobacteria bacterium]
MTTDRTARGWVVRLASGEMDEGELDRFKAWLSADPSHRAAFERERLRWRDLAALAPAFAAPPQCRRQRRLVLAAALAVAACLAVFVAWPPLRLALLTDHATGPGQRASITLPDGSVVELNTDSAIAVHYSPGERRIDLLRGEALFAVRSDKTRPFRVAARGGTAQAVGTAFVVRDRDGLVVTTVTEGTVAVASPEQAEPGGVLLAAPGDQIAYAEGQPPRRLGRADIGAVTAWRQGGIVLDGARFSDALAELERYRPGRILLLGRDPATLRPVSGIFATDRIDAAIAGLAATHGLTVSHVGSLLTILR